MTVGSRRPLGLLLGGVLAIVAVGAAISALTGGLDGTSQPPRSSTFGPARDGVCQAAEAARTGDERRARALFFDRSHQPLHELAASAQERDRAATARLLEAKARVESGLEKESPTLPEDLDALAVVTGRAMAVVGCGDPGPCQR